MPFLQPLLLPTVDAASPLPIVPAPSRFDAAAFDGRPKAHVVLAVWTQTLKTFVGPRQGLLQSQAVPVQKHFDI